MTTLFSNLSLLAHCVGKILLLTGIVPAIFFVYAAQLLGKLFRVPAQPSDDLVVSLPTANRRWVGTHPIGSQFGDEKLRRGSPSRKDRRSA